MSSSYSPSFDSMRQKHHAQFCPFWAMQARFGTILCSAACSDIRFALRLTPASYLEKLQKYPRLFETSCGPTHPMESEILGPVSFCGYPPTGC